MTTVTARILRAGEGEVAGQCPVKDRFMVDSSETGGRFALVQHLFEPGSLAAPVHRLREVDEFTFVVSGSISSLLDGEVIVANPGDLLCKPRGFWHTFWNAGDEPAVVLEVISPGGIEAFFREIDYATKEMTPEEMVAGAARYGCEVDMEATFALIEKHGLRF